MADAPEERPGDDDLKSLTPIEQLERIQELLTKFSSDAVRKFLIKHKYNVDNLYSLDSSMDALTAKDFLDTPFFSIRGLRPNPDQNGVDESRQMTANVSTTKRKVLDNYYTYSVGFGHWENFVSDVQIEDLEAQASLTEVYDSWATMVSTLLQRSFWMTIKRPGEILELILFESVFNVVVECFGFEYVVVIGGACDVEVLGKDDETPFLFLEGKESGRLPCRIMDRPQLWSELCLFGFATKIARTESSDNEAGRQALAETLGLQNDKPKLVSTESKPSSMVQTLLLKSEQCIGPLAKEIRKQRRDGHIEDTDAINLWAAVMEACHYSIRNGKNVSIVLSARMFWFIRLDTTEDAVFGYKCCVKISDAHCVGSPSFMRTLVSFIKHAAQNKYGEVETMGDSSDRG
jgi:hypothetical protein